MSLINPLPNTIANGTPVDANQVMANCNWILSQMNSAVIPISQGGTGQTTAAGAIGALGGFPLIGGVLTGPFSTTDATQSTTISTGSFVTAGGIGLAKNLWIGGTLNSAGAASVTDATQSTTTATGSIVTAGGIGLAKNLWIGGTLNSAGAASVTDATQSTTTATGSIVAAGGIGVAKNAYIGGNIVATGNATAAAASAPAHLVALSQFAASFGASGYFNIPAVVAGTPRTLFVQWGVASTATISYPVPFSTAVLFVMAEINSFNNAGLSVAGQYTAITSQGASGFTMGAAASGLPATLSWLAIGY